MTTTAGDDPISAHHRAVTQVWQYLDGGQQATIVNSPPGAGKSTLVRSTAQRMASKYLQIPIITQTNGQADDLTRDLTKDVSGTDLRIGRLHATDYRPPASIAATSSNIDKLQDCNIVVAPAAKWAFVQRDRHWQLGIIDEAYQVSSAELVRLADRFDRLLLVGDPGQLSPFTTVDEWAIRATGSWPLTTAAGTLLDTYPGTPVVELPVSWRLPYRGAAVVSDAFYSRPFRAGATETERGLRLPLAVVRHHDYLGEVIRVAARDSWCLAELPDAHLPRTDPQAIEFIAALTHRLLATRASVIDRTEQRPLNSGDIAIGVTHRDQRALLRPVIDNVCHGLNLPVGSIVVDTANRLQGRQFEIVIAWHPLSGRRDASAFHLEAGRLCVLASRHRQACIVVARAGIGEQLDAYPHTEPVWIGDTAPEVDGWEANHRFLEDLKAHTVPVDR